MAAGVKKRNLASWRKLSKKKIEAIMKYRSAMWRIEWAKANLGKIMWHQWR
jgi:hypothetical protein